MTPRFAPRCLAVLLVITLPALSYADRKIDYTRDVKPILRKHCITCHGPLKQNARLRLDSAQLIHKGSRKGKVIEPGSAKMSKLIQRVRAPEDDRMPPEGEPLNAEQIAILSAWIDQGATIPKDEVVLADPTQHWSYLTPVRPPMPNLQTEWAKNPIDLFIAKQHQKHNLTPRLPASKSVLLRRVYLDLVGVPPTRDQLRAFLNDDSEDAYEKVIDTLLSSPKYGERWGRHWMDVWRYSDWYGRRRQNEIRYSQYHIWRWRDWIIDSLNADKGYDRMILEMLAGDELEPANPETLVATSFIARNWYKFDRDVWMRDTVEHTAMGLLAMTLKCARCHDHKYDPIPQTDYYRFRAFFEPHDVKIDPIAGQTDIKKDGIPRIYDKDPNAPTYLFRRGDDRYPDKENPLTSGVPAALKLKLPEIKPVLLPVESWYPALRPQNLAKMRADAQKKIVSAKLALNQAKNDAILAKKRLETFSDKPDSQPVNPRAFLEDDFAKARPDVWKQIHGQWQYRDGALQETQVTNWAMLATLKNHPTDFQARVKYVTKSGGVYQSVGIAFDLTKKERDFQAVYTSAKGRSVQAFYRKAGKETYPPAAIIPAPAVQMNKVVTVDVVVRGSLINVWINGELKIVHRTALPRTAGRFAIWVHSGTAEFRELRIDPLSASVTLAKNAKEKLSVPSGSFTKVDVERAVKSAEHTIRVRALEIEIAKLEADALDARIRAEHAKYASPPEPDAKALAQKAANAEGILNHAKAVVNRYRSQIDVTTLPSLIPEKPLPVKAAYAPLGKPTAMQSSTGRRLALARWMTDGSNPRTARVLVNHVWARHFGRALVPSVANFGLAGQDPSHPQLLDWLAVEVVKQNWSMKWLHRAIVTSRAYQMSSTTGEENPNVKLDPENVYLWRMNYRRVEAEVVRDSVLSVTGGLSSQMGGADLDPTTGENSPRRSLYFRTTPDDKMVMLELFDLANPNQCYERRESVVPQQSLALMNNSMILSRARLLARDLSTDVKTDGEFVEAAFEQVLSREVSSWERMRCETFLKDQVELLRKKSSTTFPPTSKKVIAPSASPVMRARENLIHVLLNHNDFVTIR